MAYDSNTLTNNVEIIDFVPSETGTYKIYISQVSCAQNGTYKTATPLSIAWLQ